MDDLIIYSYNLYFKIPLQQSVPLKEFLLCLVSAKNDYPCLKITYNITFAFNPILVFCFEREPKKMRFLKWFVTNTTKFLEIYNILYSGCMMSH